VGEFYRPNPSGSDLSLYMSWANLQQVADLSLRQICRIAHLG